MIEIKLRENSRVKGAKRVTFYTDGPSDTDQSFKDDCDVNVIIDKFTKTGHLTHLAKHQGFYQDVSEYRDLAESMQVVTEAQAAFDALPAELRSRFSNSPVQMVNFLDDPRNDQEAIALGLKIQIKAEPTEQTQDIPKETTTTI